jgi:hypothetical protein
VDTAASEPASAEAAAVDVPIPAQAPAAPPAAPAPTDTTPSTTPTPAPTPAQPTIGHVFVVVLQDKAFTDLFAGDPAQSTYLKSLVPTGLLLEQYFAIDGAGLPNYMAMVAGVEPNPGTQSDCPVYDDASGCVQPATVTTLPDQLVAASLTWKGYIEGMDRGAPGTACRHPDPGGLDPTNTPEGDQGYATRHDPFVYFHSIVDHAACADADVPLTKLDEDLKTADTTPNFSLIVPDIVNGRDKADDFLKALVPKLQKSAGYKSGGLIVLTSDKAPPPAEGTTEPVPVGALLLSPVLKDKAGTTDHARYDHYSLLRSIEDMWTLDRLGKAKDATPITALKKK